MQHNTGGRTVRQNNATTTGRARGKAAADSCWAAGAVGGRRSIRWPASPTHSTIVQLPVTPSWIALLSVATSWLCNKRNRDKKGGGAPTPLVVVQKGHNNLSPRSTRTPGTVLLWLHVHIMYTWYIPSFGSVCCVPCVVYSIINSSRLICESMYY